MPEIIKTKIRGVSQENDDERSRQEIIRRCVQTDDLLLLEREQENLYDKNAIAVYAAPDDDPWDEGEYKIGYLSAELAAELAPKMDSGWQVTCAVLEKTGGADGESIGVNVALGVFTPEEVAQHEKEKFLRSKPVPPSEIFQQKPVKSDKNNFWRALFRK